MLTTRNKGIQTETNDALQITLYQWHSNIYEKQTRRVGNEILSSVDLFVFFLFLCLFTCLFVCLFYFHYLLCVMFLFIYCLLFHVSLFHILDVLLHSYLALNHIFFQKDWMEANTELLSICCKIFKVCLTILGHYALKG